MKKIQFIKESLKSLKVVGTIFPSSKSVINKMTDPINFNKNLTILELKEEELKITKKQYLKAFPYARLMKLHLWALQLTFIKMS